MTPPRAAHRASRRAAIAAGLVALALAPACARGRDGRHAPAAAEHVAPDDGPDDGPDDARDAGTLASRTPAGDEGSQLSEEAARTLLAERFRAAGFRVRYDVAIARTGAFALTVDGYDPVHRVGFEYVATAERDTDLDAAERAALARERSERILIVDAAGADGLDAAVTRFLDTARTPAARTPAARTPE